MLELLNCAPENKLILSQFFTLLIDWTQEKHETIDQLIPKKILDAVSMICGPNETQHPNPKTLLIEIFIDLCKTDCLVLSNTEPFKLFFESPLFNMIKLLIELDILDVDTLTAIFIEPDILNLNRVIALLSADNFCVINKNLILYVTFCLNKQPPNYAATRTHDYLICLKALKDLNHLDKQSLESLGKTPFHLAYIVISFLTQTRMLGYEKGRIYLDTILDIQNISLYCKIISLSIPLFIENLENQQVFLLKLLNHPHSSHQYLTHLLASVQILNHHQVLTPNFMLRLLGLSSLNKFAEFLVVLNKLPINFISTHILEHLIMSCEWQSLAFDEELKNFIPFCHAAGLFNDPILGKSNFEKLLKVKPSLNFFKEIEMHGIFNGVDNQLKLNLLLIKYRSVNSFVMGEFIALLESHHLLEYFNEAKILEKLEKYCKYDHPLELAKAFVILKQAGLISSTKFNSFFKFLINSHQAHNQAKAFVELSQHPIKISNQKCSRVKYKNLMTDNCPLELLSVLRKLEEYNLLTSERLNLAAKIKKNTMAALKKLLNENSFTPDELEIFLDWILDENHPKILELISGIVLLKQNGLLTKKFNTQYLPKIRIHVTPYDLCKAMVMLHNSSLSKTKIQNYMECSLSYGIEIYFSSKSPLKLSEAQLRKYYQGYIICRRNIYSIKDGILNHQSTIPSEISEQLVGVAVKSMNEDFLSQEEHLQSFLNLSKVQQPFNSCSNYVRCVLELEKQKFLSSWFKENHLSDVMNHFNPYYVTLALENLKDMGLYHEDKPFFILAVIAHKKPLELIEALKYIQETQLISLSDPFLEHVLKHTNPCEFVKAIHQLLHNDIFNDELFKKNIDIFINHHNPNSLAASLIELKKAKLLSNLLSSKKFKLIYTQRNPDLSLLTQAIIRGNHQALFSEELITCLNKFFRKLTGLGLHESIIERKLLLLKALLALPNELLIINQSILELVIKSGNLFWDTDKYLPKLMEVINTEYARPFSQRIIKIFLSTQSKPEILIHNLQVLLSEKLVTQDNFEFLLKLSELSIAFDAEIGIFEFFSAAGLDISFCIHQMQTLSYLPHFLPRIVHTLFNHSISQEFQKQFLQLLIKGELIPSHPNDFLTALHHLKNSDLLNIENALNLANINHRLVSILTLLKNNDIFNHDNLNFFIDYGSVFDQQELLEAFNRLTFHGLTQVHFNVIKTICLRNLDAMINPLEDIIDYINHSILGIPRPIAPIDLNPIEFNSRQSTHTATVHQSVSESITKLAYRYQAQLTEENIHKQLGEIELYLNSLQSCHINDAAMRYWQLIHQEPEFLNFTDAKSNVSIKQLLSLFWIAIQDMDIRIFELQDAHENVINSGKSLLTEAFYEAQRDGNIDANGMDNQNPIDEKPSCPSGFINKLAEKLVGVHPDIQITVINLETASEKLKAIVREKVISVTRLKIHAKKEIGEMLADNEIENAVSIVWPSIKDEIADIFFEEFKSLFKEQKDNPHFLAYLELGEDIELHERQLKELHEFNLHMFKKRHAEELEKEDETKKPCLEQSRLSIFQNKPILSEDLTAYEEETNAIEP